LMMASPTGQSTRGGIRRLAGSLLPVAGGSLAPWDRAWTADAGESILWFRVRRLNPFED